MLEVILIALQVFSRVGTERYITMYQTPDYIVVRTMRGSVVALFYGTDSFREWLGNFQFLKRTKDDFHKDWHDGAIEAYTTFSSLGYEINYVVGYSRGAAIALIYSYYFNTQAIAISAPKISKKLKFWKVPPLLISTLNDPVNWVPPGFHRPGSYTQITSTAGSHL